MTEPTLNEERGVRLAVEGCGHGTLHAIYASVEEACRRKGWPSVDLLIACGDFQSVRNAYDLNCVSMPAKYRSMGDFHEYYSGQRKAPYLTIFVGGNHEASNSLFELYYGGWVAPNMYYLGATNVVRLGPLRIAGMSGIWKGYNYRKPHHERLPYNESDMKSIYHTRELDVRKLLQIRTQVDIAISHDWPKGIEWKGDWKQLFRHKKHLEDDARNGQLGNVAAAQVMDRLMPRYWFSAHLHCKYAAIVQHGDVASAAHEKTAASIEQSQVKNDDEIDLDAKTDESDRADAPASINIGPVANEDEIELELDGKIDGNAPILHNQGFDKIPFHSEPGNSLPTPTLSAEAARAALPEAFRRPFCPKPESMEHPPDIMNRTTNFLALDKCLPGRQFLQLIAEAIDQDVEGDRPLKLEYDREWLAIVRAFALTEPLIVGDPQAKVPPPKSGAEYRQLIEEQWKWIEDHVDDTALRVPELCSSTAPVYDGGNWNLPQYRLVEEHPNTQTAHFCKMLEIPNPFAISNEEKAARMAAGIQPDPDAERAAFKRDRGGFGRGRARGRSRGANRNRYRGR